MIKLEHVVLPSAEQMDFIIEGMRNPLNSWDKMDSAYVGDNTECLHDKCYFDSIGRCDRCYETTELGTIIGPNDHSLMESLAKAGTEHRKYLRMMPVYVRITAPLYWWKEYDTYKIGTVANSCSTMHKIHAKEFTLDDFSHEHLTQLPLANLKNTINILNIYRNTYLYGGEDLLEDLTKVEYEPKSKDIWWQMIQLLPTSYNQTRNVMLNYEVLANIYKQRKNHKLTEWKTVCDWIESLPYSELIIGKERKESED